MRTIKIYVEVKTEQFQSTDRMAELVKMAIKGLFFIEPKIEKVEITESIE